MDPKGIAAAIVKKSGGGADDAEASAEGDDLQVAGANVMSAMQDGDASAFTSALKEFVSMCGADYGADED